MDVEDKPSVRNPIQGANPFSKLWFCWVWPLFVEGFKNTLKNDTIYDAPDDDTAQNITTALERSFNNILRTSGNRRVNNPEENVLLRNGEIVLPNGSHHTNISVHLEKEKRGSSAETEKRCGILLSALVSVFGWKYFTVWPILFFTDCVLRVAQPYFLLLLIRSFLGSEEPETTTSRYYYAAGVCATTLLLTLIGVPCLFYLGRLGMRTRIALTSLIQRKMLRLKLGGVDGMTNSGELVNLISNDASRLEQNITQIPYLFIGPIQLLIFMYFLWIEFGISSLAGLAFIFAFIPFQSWYGSKTSEIRQAIGEKTGKRVGRLTETVTAINSIKMYAWENIFKDIVTNCRKLEVNELRRRSSIHAFFMSIFLTSSRLVPFLTFLVFVLQGGNLTADRVFYAVAVYNTATHYIGFLVPGSIRGIGEIIGSLTRIQSFLLLYEKENAAGFKHTDEEGKGTPSVELKLAHASWSRAGFCLKDLNCALEGDKLVVIVGKVGSGKSSLLQLLLGEIPLTSGTCDIRGRISYATQDPWIFDGTIRQNIIFNNEFDQEKYQNVLRAAALEDDLRRMPKGDKTLVGDQGASLSGGQRARVNLARALYREAHIYLLDDPLSAVDSKVSRHLFEQCFKKHLRGSLRILVTHQHQYLTEADYILMVEDGKIMAQGTFDELKDSGVDFSAIGSNSSGDVDSLVVEERGVVHSNEFGSDDSNEEDTLEKQSVGSVGLYTYWKYFKAADNLCQFSAYLFIFIVSQLITTFIEYWLAIWTNAEENALNGILPSLLTMNESEIETLNMTAESERIPNSTSDINFDDISYMMTNLDQHIYLYVYSGLIAAVLATNLAKAVVFFRYCMRVCQRIHTRMLSSLLRSQPRFFFKHTSGEIMNRFTKDIGIIDEAIPFAFFDMFTIFLQIGTVISLLIFANWYTLFVIILFVITLWFVRKYYVATSRDLKRIDGITRTSVFSHITASFNGLKTIRALGASSKISHQFDHLQDTNTASTFLFLACNKCFDIWVETIATVLLTLVTFSFLLAHDYLEVKFLGGNVGLAICSAMSLTVWLQYGMRTSADVENLMISTERALEYCKLESEASLENSNQKPPAQWPAQGNLKFNKVSLSYEVKSQKVLDDLTFEIRSGEKIGIVGRTGAGKSSIIWALYRMTEPTGTISIDGINVGNLGLHVLRSSISVIPQDPVLFSGTLRFNLDPSGLSTEVDMNAVLQRVELTVETGLNFKVSDKGENLSVGQRQLVSLARALLRKKKVILMDEPTAHVDPSTDAQIQKTLGELLLDSTVITIAHRLESVIDCDRIMVMGHGKIQEFDAPYRLLLNENGALASIVRANGSDTSAQLRERAKQAYQRNSERRRWQGQGN